MAVERIGFPTVNTQAEFFVPIVYGDELDLEIFVSQTGNSSATFQYNARRTSDGTLCARATQIHVAMNLDTRRPAAIPEKYRRAFAASAG
jgi:acyl-CoA thioesterase FadM